MILLMFLFNLQILLKKILYKKILLIYIKCYIKSVITYINIFIIIFAYFIMKMMKMMNLNVIIIMMKKILFTDKINIYIAFFI